LTNYYLEQKDQNSLIVRKESGCKHYVLSIVFVYDFAYDNWYRFTILHSAENPTLLRKHFELQKK